MALAAHETYTHGLASRGSDGALILTTAAVSHHRHGLPVDADGRLVVRSG